MSRTENAIRNMAWGTIERLIMIIIPFITRTVIIQILGSEYLGLNSLFASILQVLNLSELGFSSAIVFSMYKPIAEKDTQKICALMNLYKKVYRTIGMVILVVGLAILPFLENLISGTYPDDVNIYFLYLIHLFGTVSTYFLFAYKNSLLMAHQRNDLSSRVSSLLNFVSTVLQLMIVIVFKNYYLYIIVSPIIAILNNVICAMIVDKKFPEYQAKGKLSKEELHDIKKRVFGLMIQKICATTRNSLDSIFLSAFLGLTMVAMYNNYYTIMNSIITILSIITGAITAGVGNSIATESIDKNYNDMNKFNFIYMWIAGWCTICLLCLYQPFMHIWMGEKYMFPITMVILLCVYFYVLKMGDIRSVYTTSAGIWWEGKYRSIVEAILNIILNYILGKKFGIYGIVSATLISLFFINFIWSTQITFKHYFKGKKVKEYFLQHGIYAFVTFTIGFITYKICSSLPQYGIGWLMIKAIICVMVPNIIYVIVYCRTKYFKDACEFIARIMKNVPILKKVIKIKE